jgi:hypothetical protein
MYEEYLQDAYMMQEQQKRKNTTLLFSIKEVSLIFKFATSSSEKEHSAKYFSIFIDLCQDSG